MTINKRMDGATEIVAFDSLGDLCRHVAALPPERHSPPGDTFGGGSTQEAIDKAARGATESETAAMKALIEKVDAAFRDREEATWQPDVCGAYPVVGDFLAGNPECMRRRAPAESDKAPIKLVMEVVVSAGVTVEQLRRRGAALGALAMRLGEMRPVELHVSWCTIVNGKTQLGTCRVGTSPMSPAELAFVCADPKFMRNLVFSLAYERGESTSGAYIGWGWNEAPSDRRDAKVRKLLGMTEADVFLRGGYLSEAEEFMRAPVEWVEKMLTAQREIA